MDAAFEVHRLNADLRLRPVVWLFSGLSVFADLFPINSAINQLLADLQDMLKQILNPTTVVRQRAMSDDAWEEYFSGLPGRKIELLNAEGIGFAHELAEIFDETFSRVKMYCPDGREREAARHHLEIACFYAKKGLAGVPSNQEHPKSARTSIDD